MAVQITINKIIVMFKDIKTLFKQIEELKSEYTIQETNVFYDEPPFFFYSAHFKNNLNYYKSLGYIASSDDIVAGGFSFYSKKLALLKCMYELIERFSIFLFLKKNIIFSTVDALKKSSIDLRSYKPELNNLQFGWIRGKNITLDKDIYVPAQLVFLNYYTDLANKINLDEPILQQFVSNGAVAGKDHNSTLIRGIYELVERDAMMTIYLNQINAPKIDLKTIKNKPLQTVINKLEKYQFDISLHDITHDFGIPCYLSILIDKSQVGPTLTFGLKTGFNTYEVISGSLEEALMARTWTRYEMLQNKKSNKPITSRLDRALYWSKPKAIKYISFLLNQKTVPLKIQKRSFPNSQAELTHIKELLKKKQYQIYYADIRPKLLINSNHCIYRVIIPGLQTLYLNEINKDLNYRRLREVASYFSKKKFTIYSHPHPFL